MGHFLACESSHPALILLAPGKHEVAVQVLWVACTQYCLLMAEADVFSVVHWFPSSGE